MNNTTFAAVNNSSFNELHDSTRCTIIETSLTHLLKIFAMFLFGGIGIISNIFIIVLAVKYTERRSLHHLIINMAVSDTLVVVTMFFYKLPQMFSSDFWGEIWMILGNTPCIFAINATNSTILSSFFTLLTITIQRFSATSLKTSRTHSRKKQIVHLICCWLASFGLSVIRNFTASIHKVQGKVDCKVKDYPISLQISLFVLISTVYCIILLFGTVTLRRLLHQQGIRDSLSDVQRQARAKRMANAMKMVFCSLFLFSACYVPFGCWHFYKTFAKDVPYCYGSYVFEFLEALLPLVNSCLSPAIYFLFLSDFREAAKRLLCNKSNS